MQAETAKGKQSRLRMVIIHAVSLGQGMQKTSPVQVLACLKNNGVLGNRSLPICLSSPCGGFRSRDESRLGPAANHICKLMMDLKRGVIQLCFLGVALDHSINLKELQTMQHNQNHAGMEMIIEQQSRRESLVSDFVSDCCVLRTGKVTTTRQKRLLFLTHIPIHSSAQISILHCRRLSCLYEASLFY